MTDFAILAVVPARGGSKGLPGKNVRPLAGIPLLEHSLRLARLCPEITRTIVSTDSEAIADVARKSGGDVPFLRPAELARDDTPMMPVLTHALRAIEAQGQRRYDALLLLDPTSPGRLPEDVAKAKALLVAEPDLRGVIACSKPHFNPFWVGAIERDGRLAQAMPTTASYARRQDVPPFYRINGALYLWRRDHVLDAKEAWHEGHHKLLEIPEARAFSIDDAHEFAVLEALVAAGVLKFPWLEAP